MVAVLYKEQRKRKTKKERGKKEERERKRERKTIKVKNNTKDEPTEESNKKECGDDEEAESCESIIQLLREGQSLTEVCSVNKCIEKSEAHNRREDE